MTNKEKDNTSLPSLPTREVKSSAVAAQGLIFENQIQREWLSTQEAAQFLSITENALRIMVHREQIQAYKFGRRLRFKLKDCQALFQKKEHYIWQFDRT